MACSVGIYVSFCQQLRWRTLLKGENNVWGQEALRALWEACEEGEGAQAWVRLREVPS